MIDDVSFPPFKINNNFPAKTATSSYFFTWNCILERMRARYHAHRYYTSYYDINQFSYNIHVYPMENIELDFIRRKSYPLLKLPV